MNWAERVGVARRYTFAFGQGHLSTFLSSLSMLGLVLAIALLIIVLSVMNGFDRELRQRILDDLKLPEAEIPFAGELLKVKDTDAEIWQGAVERVLHNFGLRLLVPEAHYQAVSRYVNQTNLRGRLVFHRVRDADDRQCLRARRRHLGVGWQRLDGRLPAVGQSRGAQRPRVGVRRHPGRLYDPNQ